MKHQTLNDIFFTIMKHAGQPVMLARDAPAGFRSARKIFTAMWLAWRERSAIGA
jgi:hypothetical protein